jgi:hypothetical protein
MADLQLHSSIRLNAALLVELISTKNWLTKPRFWLSKYLGMTEHRAFSSWPTRVNIQSTNAVNLHVFRTINRLLTQCHLSTGWMMGVSVLTAITGRQRCAIRYKLNNVENCGSADGVAADYGLDDRGVGVRVPVVTKFSSCRSGRLWDSPISYPVGAGALSSRVKRLDRGPDQPHPTSAEVKKTWTCTSTVP